MWDAELEFVRTFARDLESRPPLPAASPDELDAHAAQIQRLQDLLNLLASLPPERRPPAAAWDDEVAPLWRRLFARGSDIDRYTLAEPWYRLLLEAGERDRALRTLTGRIASARNFRRYDEALALAAEGRRSADGSHSAALANLLNTEGSVHYCRGDFAAAERSYTEARDLAGRLDDADCKRWIGAGRDQFLGQELFNIFCTMIDRAMGGDGSRERWLERARTLRAELDSLGLGGSFWSLERVADVEYAIAAGDGVTAAEGLAALEAEADRGGPYAYPLLATHARLLSRLRASEGDWPGAYEAVRRALQSVTRHNYPGEDQMVLDQAVAVLKGLHASGAARAERDMVDDLVRLLEDKDWYTGRSHSRSVARLSQKVAQAANETLGLGLDVERVHTAGLLHDIGKLRCPWSLLNKVAPITPRERSFLQEHSRHGRDFLREIGASGEVAALVDEHHEAMDGSGYPEGRPPSAEGAVVGICDVFEAAITPNRRYKRPKTRETALAEIRGQSGRLYHPAAVGGLLKVMTNGGAP